MLDTFPDAQVGSSVQHPELGDGVLLGVENNYARVFFRQHGERRVPADTLKGLRSWNEEVIANIKPATPQRLERLWLAIEAEQLPLMESAATLTSAKVDLLPHQIVVTHRIAGASPRRFLVADEVGLGKTIETALILRELASRGALQRAIMIVPAGLVENWRRELNDVFQLDFEVFGSEGDVTDRKSNAFAKHNRLVASIDTLKRPERVKRLLAAPRWDLVVFDEAHHLTATRTGNKVRKTQNYRLAEAIREHTRDMLLLSATPHQGDHFRFWMLIRLLDPRLFETVDDMLDNRHRLNAVVVRRTKADACKSDGSPLFARRQVNSQVFTLSELEQGFYKALQEYLQDGYNLAEAEGKAGRALGFVMTIFQKIAASSFAAVRQTLTRRLLSLTIHQAIQCDEDLNVEGRESALAEARAMIRQMHGLADDMLGRAEAERILSDARYKLLQKLKVKQAELEEQLAISDMEAGAATGEETAATLVSVALPEERRRIRELLAKFPSGVETKAGVLIDALTLLWSANPDEKVIVFTTYLGSVDSLKAAVDARFPEAGVEVLKGGDHGAKVAAERRFKKPTGPKMLICTAAGREGINLQFARILFNHDLPWNPMDLEQRIGRIHRYGQRDTAQVYNLVAGDTIEGEVYLLLEQKLQEIARAVGKIDDKGQVAEDFRGQILGQLAERLSYDQLYRDALRDPTLRRTKQELEVALDNARTARQVVFELFQDLDRFRLDDYHEVDDAGRGMKRLLDYVATAAPAFGGSFVGHEDETFTLEVPAQEPVRFTTDRDRAIADEHLALLGLEHPLIRSLVRDSTDLPAADRGVWGCWKDGRGINAVVGIWQIEVLREGSATQTYVVPIALDGQGNRNREYESIAGRLRGLAAADGRQPSALPDDIIRTLQRALERELEHSGRLGTGGSFGARLLGAVVSV